MNQAGVYELELSLICDNSLQTRTMRLTVKNGLIDQDASQTEIDLEAEIE